MCRPFEEGFTSRLRWAISFVLVALIPHPAVAEGENAPPRGLPNIVFIIVDTLRNDRIEGSRNGHPLMPGITRIAAEGQYFDRCFSQDTWTLPSVTSIFTSLYPEVHGIRFSTPAKIVWRTTNGEFHKNRISKELPTGAELLHKAGYATLAVQSNAHLQNGTGLERGFDKYEYQFAALGDWVTNEGIRLAASAQRPFFLYCHYFDPHSVYVEHPELFNEYGAPPICDSSDEAAMSEFIDYYVDQVYDVLHLQDERKYKPLSEAGREKLRYLYDVECAYTDRQIQRLLEALTHLGKFDANTIFILTSDHGEEFWDHGAQGHAKTVYQELANVPLIFRLPGVESRRVSSPVECIDILPTLFAYLGLEIPTEWQGRNLLPMTSDDQTHELRPAFTSARGTRQEAGIDFRAVRWNDYTLIIDDMTDKHMLFNFDKDPHEKDDLIEDDVDTAEKLVALWTEHERSNQIHPLFIHEKEYVEMDKQSQEELEALGYGGRLGLRKNE